MAGTTLPLFFLLLPLLFSFSFLSSLLSFPFPGAFSAQSNGQWSMVNAGPLTIDHSALTSFLFLFLFLSFLFLPLPACSFRVPAFPLSSFLSFAFEGKRNPDSKGINKPRKTQLAEAAVAQLSGSGSCDQRSWVQFPLVSLCLLRV